MARNVVFDFRKGSGANTEIMFGEVSMTPTMMHSVGTSAVIPAPTTADLVNGKATMPNVAPSPDPVAGQVEWAYKVSVTSRHGKKFEWLVGVPDDISDINFIALPRYYETKPPLFGQGPQGVPGTAATVAVGSTTSGPTPAVTNTGTSTDAVLNFTLARGDKGDKGDGVAFETKLFSDSPATYANGTTYVNGSIAAGWPVDFLTVTTNKQSWGRTVQWLVNDTKSYVAFRTDQSGSWTSLQQMPSNSLATPLLNGLMPALDKAKLDGMTPAANSKTFAALASTYQTGFSVLQVRAADGWPLATTGTVVTQKNATGNGAVSQWLYAVEGGAPRYRVTNATGSWLPFSTVATEEYVESRQGYVTPEEFGATGSGAGNDGPAINAAIAAAGGRSVYLRSGATYRTTQSIVNAGNDVVLTSDGQATILSPSQAFTVLDYRSDSSPIVKTLQSSQTIGGKAWALNNTVGVEVGMLATVKSSQSWYYDPRPESTDGRKSELHKVISVEGNIVSFEDLANDGYDTGVETVEVSFVTPIKVSLSNITVKATLPPYASSTPSCTGIVLTDAVDVSTSNVSVERSAYAGVRLFGCYGSQMQGGHVTESNYVSTGYGVQTYGCAKTLISQMFFAGCRRGVDFSGGNIISRYSVVESCINLGGGRESTGRYYGWKPDGLVDVQNYGFGSHGTSDYATYRNNLTSYMHMPYSLRGGNEAVENNRHVGRTRNGFISLITGANFTARGNSLVAGYEGKNTTAYDGSSSIPNRRADYFIRVFAEYDTSSLMNINITDNVAQVHDTFAMFDSGKLPSGPTIIMGNSCVFQGAGVFLRHNGPLTAGVFRWTVGPNSVNRTSGTSTDISMTENINLSGAKVLTYTTSGPTT